MGKPIIAIRLKESDFECTGVMKGVFEKYKLTEIEIENVGDMCAWNIRVMVDETQKDVPRFLNNKWEILSIGAAQGANKVTITYNGENGKEFKSTATIKKHMHPSPKTDRAALVHWTIENEKFGEKVRFSWRK